MASTSGQPRVWSLWIYDRHCSLLYHADWSSMHNRNATVVSSSSAALSLSEQSKLVYGVVFSLRNMTRKLSPIEGRGSNGTPSTTATTSETSNGTPKETFHSFSTSTYTLSHLQTPTNYTFILLTDLIAPPTRRAPSATSSTFSGGGGIPSTGGMSTTGVLSQIARGPWVEFVARNAACTALERMEDSDDDGGDDDDDDDDDETGKEATRASRISERKKARQKELERQRMTGLGKSIDSEAFRGAVERVLAQNKLNAPRM